MKTIDTTEYLDTLCEILKENKAVSTVVQGGSMLPFLSPGRDFVILENFPREPVRGDIVLYKRNSGDYVLHRIRKIKNGEFFLIGDRQSTTERGIRKENLCALVTEVKRKGKLIDEKSFIWFFYKRIWLAVVPLRGAIIKLKNLTKKTNSA